MRRTFLRTSGSPQAPAIVETPAHYAPTLFCRLARLFGGGDWECQSLICRYIPKNAANLHKKLQIRSLKKQKSHKME